MEFDEEDFLDFRRDREEGWKITGSARQMIIDYLHDNDAAGWKSDSLLDYEDPDYQNMGEDEI